MTFDKFYLDWNYKRIKYIIKHFGHEAFFDKTVLDLGCGHGDIGGALARLGARVIAVDARQEHLNIAKKKYPHITTVCADLDKQWPFNNQTFDFVLNLGLICHLTNYRQILQHSCNVAHNLILESEICDSNEPERIIQVDEHRSIYDSAYNGIGHKPSAVNLETIIQNCGMLFERIDNSALNTGPFKYNWVVGGSGNRKIGHRRLWFATKNNNLVIQPLPKLISQPLPPDTLPPQPNTPPLTILPKTVINASKISKNNDFKVAVCISGHMRSFEKTFGRLLDNLLKSTNPDIFIHTWEFIGAPLRGFDAPTIRISTNSMLQRINTLYKPQKIVIEPTIRFPTHPLMHQRNFEKRDINGVLGMFFKIKACNQLKREFEKQHNFKYDCVIRLRSDLMLMSPLHVGPDLNVNKLYIPMGYDHNGLNDQIAYGSSAIMDRYSAIMDNIESLLIGGIPFNPEKLLLAHIIRSGIPIERTNLNYYIKRAM